jgi:hypothetical protein
MQDRGKANCTNQKLTTNLVLIFPFPNSLSSQYSASVRKKPNQNKTKPGGSRPAGRRTLLLAQKSTQKRAWHLAVGMSCAKLRGFDDRCGR